MASTVIPKKILIITTSSDISLGYFTSSDVKAIANVDYVYYQDDIEPTLAAKSYDAVYFRDPFNDGSYDTNTIKQQLARAQETQPQAVFIDGITSLDDLLFEDKWHQYQYKNFAQYMPLTSLFSEQMSFETGKHILKKRISSRAKGIAFDATNITNPDDYIIQPIIAISREYRVYVVNGTILPLVSKRSSKSLTQKIKVTGIEPIDGVVEQLAKTIAAQLPQLDLSGLDIAIDQQGTPVLLEVNRSCQFKTYSQRTGVNVAYELLANIAYA